MRTKRIRRILCLLPALLIPLGLLASAFCLPAQYGETYLGGLSVKWEALCGASSPKLVLVGGSGVAFDVRSDLLERELEGYEVVNFGLYAGLGTTVMLDLCRDSLREGDIVVFSPELSEQTLSTYFSAEAMWQAADTCPDALSALGSEYLGPMAGAFPAFAASKLRYALTDTAPRGDGIYAASSFNRWGDLDAPGRESNVMPEGYDPNLPLCFDADAVSRDFVDKVNAFSAWCADRGVSFRFRWCPMNAAAVTPAQQKLIGAFSSAMEERLDCEILGNLRRVILEPEWFYDTNFHLNSAGSVVNTALLAEELKSALGDSSEVAIELPPMPRMGTAVLQDGDDSDADCFLYEIREADAVIVGLTELGKTRNRLVVPASREGLPVVSFSEDVFAGDELLEEIVLQSSLRQIPDGAFRGCAALERIVLWSSSPAGCTVGKGLLDGTDACVWVPQEAYSVYCTNYFWSIHADRLRADAGLNVGSETAEPPELVPTGSEILYLGNGGTLRYGSGDRLLRAAGVSHLRVNTLQGSAYFRREGWVLTGWNTEPDGSGTETGLGSRVEPREGLTLWAQWAQANPVSDFSWQLVDGELRVTGFSGGDGVCVLPETIAGKPVRAIEAGAFRGKRFSLLVLPSSLQRIGAGAFSECEITELVLFDSLREIGDACFVDCVPPRTLRINAAVAPVYSGSYFDTFSDKYDYLLSVANRRKLVLFSGSSGRYGYDTPAIRAAFPEYEAVNMGVYAYTSALPQLEILRAWMGPGDVLISAPEFDAIEEQFCTTNRLDRFFWAMMESNYDAARLLDLRGYADVFDSLGAYLRVRRGMEPKSYLESPSSYDDDGNRYDFATYNLCGDFILPRENRESDERQHLNTADYTVASFPETYLDRLNAVYDAFLERGVTVYFSYTPRSRSSLTERSTPEARAALHAYLCDGLRVPVISQIEDYLLPGVYFWKIDSHPSTEGAAIRTARLIEDLRAAINADKRPE